MLYRNLIIRKLRETDKTRVVYTLNKDRLIIRQELFQVLRESQLSSPKEVKTLTCEIKRTKSINGFNIPLEIEGQIFRENNGLIMTRGKYVVKLIEESISMNTKLNETFFMVKIPVGTYVMDKRTGITYEADGISDPQEESLGDALEDFVKKAKNIK